MNSAINNFKWLLLVFFLLFTLSGCISSQPEVPSKPIVSATSFERELIVDDVVLIKIKAEDSFESLARLYLNDPERGWMISQFNGIDELYPGQTVLIPLNPVNPGGIYENGFQTVPLLVYHRFSKHRASDMIIPEAKFDRQMNYLKQNGYKTIGLDTFLDFMEYKSPVPSKSILLTIDDGWKSTIEIAVPILRKYGFTATIFVYTDFIGGGKAMTWEQLQILKDQGFDIQCHTKTHRYLTRRKSNESIELYFNNIENEIVLSTQLIKEKLNHTCKHLAYPYGETNPVVIEIMKKHGYRSGLTVSRGSNPFFFDNYKINRSTIYGHLDIDAFKKNLMLFDKEDLR